MNQRQRLCCFTLLVMFLGVFLSPNLTVPVHSQGENKPCRGLDLVILVSQAGSIKNHDWYSARTNGVRTAIDYLGDNALHLCPGYQHRLAVLGFGDTPDGDIPNSEADYQVYVQPALVNPTLAAIEQWSTQRSQMRRDILDRDPHFSNNYTTNANNAAVLNKASQIFQAWEQSPLPDAGTRRRALIWITDGNMLTEKNAAMFRSTIEGDRENEGLRDILDPEGAKFPWRGADNPESIDIFLIGLFSQGGGYEFLADPVIKPFLMEVTDRHGAEKPGANYIYDEEAIDQLDDPRQANVEVDSLVSLVMNQLLGSTLENWDCNAPIWVEPYTSSVQIFHLFRTGSEAGLPLEDVKVSIKVLQQGREVVAFERGKRTIGTEGEVGDYTTGTSGLSERYIFYSPPPGRYQIDVQGADACQDLEVQFGERGLNSLPMAPLSTDYLEEEFIPDDSAAGSPYQFRLQLLQPIQARGEVMEAPLKEVPRYPLNLQVTVNSQDDVIQPVSYSYPLLRVEEAQAIYESRDPETLSPLFIATEHPGHYDWEIVGTTIDPRHLGEQDAPPLQVFRESGTFVVTPKDRSFTFDLLPLQGGQKIQLLDGVAESTLPVEVHVLGTAGEPLRSDLAIAGQEASPFQATLKHEDGTTAQTALLILRNGTNNIYDGVLDSGITGQPMNFRPGCYTVEVELTEDYKNEIYFPQIRKISSEKICMYWAERFAWQVLSPQENQQYQTHPQLRWFPAPNPVKVVLQATTPDGSRVLPVEDFQGDSTQTIFSGTLQVPGFAEPLGLTFQTDVTNDQFVAEWPEQASYRGNYILTISLRPQALPITKVSIQNNSLPVQFSLYDTYLSVPWALLMWIILAALVALLLMAIWANNGKLYGAELSFTTGRGARQPINGSTRLYRLFRTRKYTAGPRQLERDLTGSQIQKITARKVAPNKPEARVAADLEVFYDDGTSYPIPGMDEGDSVSVLQGVNMTLGCNNSSFLGRTWWLWLLGLIAVLAWGGIYYYLYNMA